MVETIVLNEDNNAVKYLFSKEKRLARNVWKYNQIDGFVEIAITSRDILFNVQKTLDKRIQAVGRKKHYI